MGASHIRRDIRARLVSALRHELVGPSDPAETIDEYPTSRYIVGRLAPARENGQDQDAAISAEENDALGAGEEDDETGASEESAPLIIGFHPSSIGLSFLVEPSTTSLRARVTWGDYKREKGDEDKTVWRRYAREAVVTGIPVNKPGTVPRIPLSQAQAPAGVAITGIDDPEITLDGVVHDLDGSRAISLFLVNRRTKAELKDRTKDERWLLQAQLEITAPDDKPIFLAKTGSTSGAITEDDEVAISNLLYRDAREYATGHGVAAGWDGVDPASLRAQRIYTDFLPDFEVPSLIAPAEKGHGASLDMRELSRVSSGTDAGKLLQPLVTAYSEWVAALDHAASAPEITSDPQLRDAAKVSIERCRSAAQRMQAGLALIGSDPQVLKAFQFSNHTMWDQRIHSLWAIDNRKKGEVQGSPADFDKAENRTWRPFQMGFILLNLVAIAKPLSDDRKLVDLLWFPTGGGKTEAYLGLAAFTIALRRLKGDQEGMHAGAGISIIMRYTLRLLTVQQFQRAAALICACEVTRVADPNTWGSEPFRIGLWVGRNTTPNDEAGSLKALEDINDGKRPKEGSPVQLVSCPRCGTALVNDKGKPESQTYKFDDNKKRTLVCCRNPSCEFCGRKSPDGLPVVMVDNELYRTCPTFLIATVDKFARMPYKGETQGLFGLRDRYSPTYGHMTEAHGDKVAGRKIRDAQPAARLLPPDLIIQDELHLISGPLGTMVGLYETAVDHMTSWSPDGKHTTSAKIIASTATIRRAHQQARQLYARELRIFPPNGLTAKDSFFAEERPINIEDDGSSGRLYLGVNAPGSSTKTLLVRVYSALLAAAQAELDTDAANADPYGTLVGYFNSLRALGGAKRLVEDDIKNVRLKYLHRQRGFPNRNISDPEELTSRLDSWKIPGLLKKLDNTFPRGKENWPVDVLLATNMISVGVDIDRLGLMAVTGQPKSTSEYIQATSRVGRKYPGLVVTMYNWLGARDLSHYERFRSYHAALYRHVEAISVTPYSSRALDRGLQGVFAGLNRLAGPAMAQEPEAQRFDPAAPQTMQLIDEICIRAEQLVGKDNAKLVRERLLAHRDDWARLTDELLRYSWLQDDKKPPNNSRVLIRTLGTNNEGEWPAPGSLREVEATAAFFLAEKDEGDAP